MHWIKEHGQVLAACDEELLGKQLKDEDTAIKVKETFYKGHKTNKKELQEHIKKYRNLNLVGKKTIQATEEIRGTLDKMKIGGVPHALVFTMKTR